MISFQLSVIGHYRPPISPIACCVVTTEDSNLVIAPESRDAPPDILLGVVYGPPFQKITMDTKRSVEFRVPQPTNPIFLGFSPTLYPGHGKRKRWLDPVGMAVKQDPEQEGRGHKLPRPPDHPEGRTHQEAVKPKQTSGGPEERVTLIAVTISHGFSPSCQT